MSTNSIARFHGVSRRAFTLVELIVVLAILLLLGSLALPAIQQSRSAANRIACVNQLRELGLASQHYLSVFNVFPTNGGYKNGSGLPRSDGSTLVVSTLDKTTGEFHRWGVGHPGLVAAEQTGSWGFAILPYCEELDAFQQLRIDSGLRLFHCPSKNRDSSAPEEDVFGVYEGGGVAWTKTDYCANANVANSAFRPFRVSSVGDGLSNTIWLGEKAIDPTVQVAKSWFYDEPVFTGGSQGTARRGTILLTDSPGISFRGNWGSAHPSVVLFAFMDGSVVPVSKQASWVALERAMLPNDGRSHELR